MFTTPPCNLVYYQLYPMWSNPAYVADVKYKEGNNRPSSVNQTPLVYNHDKAENKCYTQDNTNTRENTSVRISAAKE